MTVIGDRPTDRTVLTPPSRRSFREIDHVVESLPGGARSLIVSLLVGAIGLLVVLQLGGNFYDSIFVVSVSYAIVALGMVVQIGYSHQLAFSQSVFMCFGAYGVAVLNTKYAWPIPLAILVVVPAGAVVGAVLGRTVTKVPGFALALATLFMSIVVTSLITFSNYLGGSTGIPGVAAIWTGSSFTSTLMLSGSIGIALLAVSFFVCHRIIKSGIGLELALLGTNESMAASIGVRVPRRKLELFVLGSALATLGGGVFAGTQGFISTTSFDQTAQLTLLIMLFLGGRGSLFGPLIGAFGIEYLSGTSNFVASNLLIIEGILFTVILLYAPGGLTELIKGFVLWVFRHVRALRGVAEGFDPSPELEGEPVAAAGAFGSEETSSTAEVDPEALAAAVHNTARFAWSAHPELQSEDVARLEVRNLTKRFGGVVAVDDVSLSIHGLGIHAICGPNGAGKSTLFELVSGGFGSDGGRVFIAGKDVTHLPAFDRAELGLSRTLQSVQLMNHRSVLDNVAVAALPTHRTFMSRAIIKSEMKLAYEHASEAIEHIGISHMERLRPGQLTLEAQRMVELARAIVSRPNLLLLDEPASGLSVEQRERLADTLVALGEETTILLVEHDLQMVARVSKEIFVLIDGHLAFSGNSSEFLSSNVVRTELMGLLPVEPIAEIVAPVDRP